MRGKVMISIVSVLLFTEGGYHATRRRSGVGLTAPRNTPYPSPRQGHVWDRAQLTLPQKNQAGEGTQEELIRNEGTPPPRTNTKKPDRRS